MVAVIKLMEEHKSLLSSIISTSFYPQIPQEDSKVRRLRKKAKDVVDGDAEDYCDGKKRRLSEEQVRFLEMNFDQERKLESCRKFNLATEIGLEPKQVAVWFQNRRARWKIKRLEEDYNRFKSSHDAVVMEKLLLEKQILDLKEKLAQSEEEIRRLTSPSASAASEVAGVGSPISSLTMATHLGEFKMDEDNGLHMSAFTNNYYEYDMMEMSYLCGF